MKSVVPIIVHQRKPVFPVTLGQKSHNNNTGLCNQIFKLINAIHLFKSDEYKIYVDLFSKDYRGGKLIKISEILDINIMNELHNYNLNDVTELIEPPDIVDEIGYVFECYHKNKNRFIEIVKSLVFNKKLEEFSKIIIEHYKLYDLTNLVHLRIDSDFENYLVASKSIDCFNSHINSYRKIITDNCKNDKKLVVLMEDVEHPFVNDLKFLYDVVFFDKSTILKIYNENYNDEFLEGREIFALIDLIIGKNLKVDNYIGCENTNFSSSFSVLLKYLGNYNKILMV
jgi:hypothetical protein